MRRAVICVTAGLAAVAIGFEFSLRRLAEIVMVKAPTPTPVMAGMVVQKMPSGQMLTR